MRLIFLFPDGETASTTSILLPQLLQTTALPLFPARAETSVLDFPFSAISHPPFDFTFYENPVLFVMHTQIPCTVSSPRLHHRVQTQTKHPRKRHKTFYINPKKDLLSRKNRKNRNQLARLLAQGRFPHSKNHQLRRDDILALLRGTGAPRPVGEANRAAETAQMHLPARLWVDFWLAYT
jgi:hypothetical protein